MFTVVSPIAAAEMSANSGRRFTTWLVVQILATALAFLIPQIRQWRADQREVSARAREVEARVATLVTMNDALDPILRLLGRLALENRKVERDKLRAQAISVVLIAATQLIGPDRVRACWFRLDPGPPLALVPVDSIGRSGSASTTFAEGTASGAAVIEMVQSDGDRLCEDIQVDPPPGWDSTKVRDYRTFISVSVIAGDTAYGMLTLDALEPGDLSRDDMRLLRLMAGALAVAMSFP